MKKILLAASAVALLAAGCSGKTATNTNVGTYPSQQTNAQAESEQTPPEKLAPVVPAKGVTDAELNTSLKSVDSNMDSLSSDSASIDSSLGEQQAP